VLNSCLGYSFNLEDEGDDFSEKSVDFQRATGMIAQKMELFIPTAARASHPQYVFISVLRYVDIQKQYNLQKNLKYTILCINSVLIWYHSA
jgi:hypothetical protein